MKTAAIDGTEQVYDSRDIIARIEYLEQCALDDDDSREPSPEDTAELEALRTLAKECEGYSDWQYGEQLISVYYFVSYIEELINDCYEIPKGMNSGDWPWRHMNIDYAAAAKEAEQDYALVTFMGHDFFIRNCYGNRDGLD